MNKYNTILFDLDDTLLDFKKGEDVALKALFKEMNVDSIDKLMDEYKVLNQSLWHDLENGKVSRDYVLYNRFFLLFQKYNKPVDGKEIENRYRYYLNLQHQCIEGAAELLESLYSNYRLYIITNGVIETQRKRIQDAKLDRYFEDIFISEEIGFDKPKREFFNAAMSRIPGFETRRTLVVGDSLNADILGGSQLNIDTCWINQHMKKNHTGIKPTYEICHISDLNKVLNS